MQQPEQQQHRRGDIRPENHRTAPGTLIQPHGQNNQQRRRRHPLYYDILPAKHAVERRFLRGRRQVIGTVFLLPLLCLRPGQSPVGITAQMQQYFVGG